MVNCCELVSTEVCENCFNKARLIESLKDNVGLDFNLKSITTKKLDTDEEYLRIMNNLVDFVNNNLKG